MIAAELVVKSLEAQGVRRIFAIPGAKVDSIFNALKDSTIELVICRHEQNATFMAQAHGRLTGQAGVVVVTSGPGVGNLTTALMTATTEGDPVVAIGGNVPRNMLYKASHQSAQNMKLMEAVTKSSKEIYDPANTSEAIANAFMLAEQPRSGACFISFPQDVLLSDTTATVIERLTPPLSAQVPNNSLQSTADLINRSKNPIIFLGEESSRHTNINAVQQFIRALQLPVICSYQGAGVVPIDLLHLFFGRVGLFANQAGDILLKESDCIITIGFNPVEYDPEVWFNHQRNPVLIHIDYTMADIRQSYQPNAQILGDIALNLVNLQSQLTVSSQLKHYIDLHHEYLNALTPSSSTIDTTGKIHPLRLIHLLQQHIDKDTIVACDIGSNYMWSARYLLSFTPRQLLFSNGQQTLGVAMPWAISSKMTFPKKKVFSISGDGGFLFSAMELETAVRFNVHFIHFVWVDGCYDMVKEQEEMKYHRKSGVDFGEVDLVKFAQSFGATGYKLDDSSQFEHIMTQALQAKGPVIIEVSIDYRDNPALFAAAHPFKN
ncbi:acetolactate synthase AlsS [Cysteiniphilum sp. JM-1]|uniref:acetolactate synthase AlsS n=1 Tax=Cysteiniphilum sp. JM-1 TaxID=2610891 RepID=UPI0012473633|nr:acetolactate synthase AlsS [Cysteiniphilum sp. JM-1]